MVNDKESEVVLQNGMESSDGLAYDWIHKNLYWTDTGLNKIGYKWEIQRIGVMGKKYVVD